MSTITVQDRQSFKLSQRQITDEGFLRAPAIVARTGIQDYLGSELKRPDMAIVRVYRPEEEVFDAASLESYDNQTITDDHPDAMVTADSFRTTTHGHIMSPGRRDGDNVVADLLFKSADSIAAIQSGKVEVSAGYSAEYDFTPGTTPSGESYDAIQRNIRINHLALVDRGRAGNARVFDSKNPRPQEASMSHVTLDSGDSVEVADASTAKLIQNSFDSLRKQVKDAQSAMEEAKEAKSKAEAAKEKAEEDKESAEQESKDAAAVLDKYRAREAMDAARVIVGKEFTCDSTDPLEIKRAALAVKRPKIDWASKDAAYVSYAWDAESDKDEEEREKDKGKETGDAFAEELKARYGTADGAAMSGTSEYHKFLKGGK